ncbi:hypothetical protein GTR02_14600 [Kineococcus sp. R8]|uniref:hypothetical protein n=1 Tax=Kineococcus siccus TaxID=2696567 RepID=UPI001412E31C|nr:hypothetical protein [Kineococcus siccus]NAZ83046.1 hypothetical protein [Kineococcus siccus]
MADDLLRNPANFLELMLLPHLHDGRAEVTAKKTDAGTWAVQVRVDVDGDYTNEADAQAVTDYYRDNLHAYLTHQRARRRSWRRRSETGHDDLARSLAGETADRSHTGPGRLNGTSAPLSSDSSDLPVVGGQLGQRLQHVEDTLTIVESLAEHLPLPATEQARLLDLRASLRQLHRSAGLVLLVETVEDPSSSALGAEVIATADHLLQGARLLQRDVQQGLLQELGVQRRYAEAKHQASELELD